MKSKFHTIKSIAVVAAAISTVQLAAANTAVWIGNAGVTTTTNWSDNANWNNIGAGGLGPNGNDVNFGDAGGVGTAGTISSVVDNSALNPLSMTFTNESHSPNFKFHTVLIPAGVGMTNANGLTVGVNSAVNGYLTTVNFVGDGTFAQNGANLTVKDIGSAANTGARATLDLSGLSNFVYNASGGTLNVAGTGSDARGGGTLTLAATNNITVGTISVAVGNGNVGAGGILNLGSGPNIINAGTINICIGKVNTATVKFLGATGSLKVRGIGGTDADRANFLFANRNAGGTGNLNGTLDLTGHPVDIKAGTITLGQGTSNPTGTSTPQPGIANFSFDAGTVDATTINMAVNSQALAATTGNLTVGGGSLTVSNVSLVNQTAGTGTGNLYVGGTITCSGNITKTTLAGTGNITITNGTLTVASGKVVGTPDKPIDNISLTSATLNLSVLNNLTNIAASALNLVDAANTVNISALPSIGAFPTQIPIITYTSFPGAGSLNLVTLPGGFSGYVSNDTVNTLWLVITNGPFIAKADLWSGGVNNNWDTATLNWTNAGSAVTYNEGDFVTFDDSAKTNNVNLSGLRLPASLTVSNNALNYTFYGSGSIGGSVGLLKDGTGSLTLSETGGDNFTGGIVISNGTVILDNFGSAVSGGLTVNSGATAQIGNNSTNGVLPSGNVVVDGTLVFKRTNDLTVATVISGAGSLIKSASGKLTLSGVQAYTGGTIITNGTLALTGAGTISNSAQVVVSGATLDLTGASGQTILASLNLTNANLSVAMPNVTTPVNVTGLNMGGAGNTINVSALPTIAAYPVTVTLVQSASAISGFNASLGTLPAASPAFAGSVALSGDQLAVRLTLTSGPIGVRPAMFWSGGDAPNLNWSDGLNWLLPGAPTAADNVVFNNTATASASALTTPGGGSSALDPGNFNNIVDANFSVSSLTYTNLGGTYHNTHLANGRTLTMTNVMTVGAVDAGATTTQEGVTISGSTATVTVNNTNANVQVWLGSANVNHQATLDLSALDNFSANVSRLTVGASAVNNAVNRPSGILYLAKTNSISAGFQTTTIEAGTTTGNAGIVVADCNQNAGSASFLYLGNVNTISADTIAIARQKTTATLAFNPIYVNVAPFPTATLQGFTSSRISVFDVSSGAGNTGTTTGTGTADFSGGIVNALVDTLSVGRASTPASGNSAGTTTGVLTFDAGTINANTLNLGLQPAAFHNLKVGIGTLTVGTNSTIGVAAKLIVNSNLNLAVNAGNATTAGTLNINGGTVQAGNIVAGVNGATSTINLTEGTLIVTNTAGTPAAPLTTLNLNGGTVQLNLDGSSGVANVVATTVAVTATTTIKVGAIVNVAAATTYPLVSYAGSDPYASLILAPLPAGYAGNLVDDTANSLISLMITTAPAQPPVITSITLSGGSVVFSGNNGVANAPYHVLGSTNIALPLGSWSDVGSGTFDSSGNFSFTNAVGPGPQLFYILRTP